MDLEAIVVPTERALKRLAESSARETIGQIGADEEGLVDQVNELAAQWARERSASLVGKRYDEDGELVDSNTEYNIDATTRDLLREDIADALEEGLSAEDLAARLEENYAFSEERAALIAETEISRANNEASLFAAQAAEQMGLGMRKAWLTDDDPCDLCEENADQGFIDLDEEFPSGDDAPPGHPNCKCTLIFEVQENSEEED